LVVGTSGAVDEDTFDKSFGQVPDIVVSVSSQVNRFYTNTNNTNE